MFCPQCGKEIAEQQVFCQFCGAKNEAAIAPPPGPGRMPPPWEAEGTQWTTGGFTATLRRSLFEPSAYFRDMQVTGGLAGPLVYAMIACMTGFMLSYLWQILLHDVTPAYLHPGYQAGHVGELFSGIGMAAAAILMPFGVVLVLFLWTGIFHVLLLMVRGAKNGFEATFRTVAYSSGTTLLLAVPFCGWIVASVWNIVVLIIGFREAHGTTGGKSAFAVLTPLVLCCTAAVLFTLLLLGTVAASFGTMPQQPWK